MKEKITANWNVDVIGGSECITLDSLNCKTIEEWKILDREEQRNRIQNALDDLPERVNIVVDDWD